MRELRKKALGRSGVVLRQNTLGARHSMQALAIWIIYLYCLCEASGTTQALHGRWHSHLSMSVIQDSAIRTDENHVPPVLCAGEILEHPAVSLSSAGRCQRATAALSGCPGFRQTCNTCKNHMGETGGKQQFSKLYRRSPSVQIFNTLP